MSDNEQSQPAAEVRSGNSAPLIFISHDTRDGSLAEEFSNLLTDVSAGILKTFRSSDKTGAQGIAYGTDWYPRVMHQLCSASDVVCLLTARSVERPWILYEAGVAKGRSNDVPVHGLALGIPMAMASAGPFAQFQNCAGDEEALTSLVMQLTARIPDSKPNRAAVKMQVTAFLTRTEPLLADIIKAPSYDNKVPTGDANTVAKLFEEVKVMFQDLPARLDALTRDRFSIATHPQKKASDEMLEILRGIVAGRVKVSTSTTSIQPEIPNNFPKAPIGIYQEYPGSQGHTRDTRLQTLAQTLLEKLLNSLRLKHIPECVLLKKCQRAWVEGDDLILYFLKRDELAKDRLDTAELRGIFREIANETFPIEAVELKIDHYTS